MTENNNFPMVKSTMALTSVDPSAIAAAEAAKARIQSAYIMALQKPRNQAESRNRILMACKRTEFARRAEFSKPIGNTTYVKGPSIRFAELSLREWGNVMSEVQVLYEDDSMRRARVSVLDLETNTQFTKDIQIKRTIERRSKKGREDDVIGERKNSYSQTVFILRATDEEMYTKEAAWVSKVLRNEGLRLIPTDIIEEGLALARKTAAAEVYQDPEGEKKKLLDAFSGIGVKPSEIEKYLQHPVETVSPAELMALRSIYQSIKDGESTWFDYLADKQEGKAAPIQEAAAEYITTEPDKPINDFEAAIAKETGKAVEYHKWMDEFVTLCADGNGISEDEFKAQAVQDIPKFMEWYKGFFQKKLKQAGPATVDEMPEKVKSQAPLPEEETAQTQGNGKAQGDSKPEDTGNWWDLEEHWKFRRGKADINIVRVGLGLSTANELAFQEDFDKLLADNPGAAGTIFDANKAIKKKISDKINKKYGKGTMESMVKEAHGEVAPDEPPSEHEIHQDQDDLSADLNRGDGQNPSVDTSGIVEKMARLEKLEKSNVLIYKAVMTHLGPVNQHNIDEIISRIETMAADPDMSDGAVGPPAG
jgi:hypothetical protein